MKKPPGLQSQLWLSTIMASTPILCYLPSPSISLLSRFFCDIACVYFPHFRSDDKAKGSPMSSTVSLTMLCAPDPSDLLHSMPLLLILKRLPCYSASITYFAHTLPSIGHSSDLLLSSYPRLKSRRYLAQIVAAYTSMSHTSTSWLWLDRVDEVPMMPCNRVAIMIKFRALICHGFLRSSICSLLGLTSPLQERDKDHLWQHLKQLNDFITYYW
ncbi:hypothetical protein Cgig2_009438 [Carnegiea gigantea]|uniref:Uncharacterized protein n=1 Tax=Carnegiea gigantea TaxID=171969 RepID=A0A9Q1K791_9CARY|nr:hypothetical protein Cgig2_009438 [Carnegiea gigantea]